MRSSVLECWVGAEGVFTVVGSSESREVTLEMESTVRESSTRGWKGLVDEGFIFETFRYERSGADAVDLAAVTLDVLPIM